MELDSTFFDVFGPVTTSGFSCKIPIKPLCTVFKSNLKTMKHMTVRAHTTRDRGHELAFELAGQGGVVRTHRFHYADCDVMNALFDADAASYLSCRPAFFADVLEHFYQSPELKIEASSSVFTVSSFHQDDAAAASAAASAPSNNASGSSSSSSSGGGVVAAVGGSKKHLSTTLSVNVAEFDEYVFNGEAPPPEDPDDDEEEEGGVEPHSEELVACVKEMRAMLQYCVVVERPTFVLYFTAGGRPIKLSSGTQNDVQVDLVLATLETHRQALRQQGHRLHHQQQQPQPQQQQQQPQPQLTSESEVVRPANKTKKRRIVDEDE